MACAGARESGRQGSRAAQRPAPTVSTVGPELQPDAEAVGQVQLYQGDDERQWPILLLGGRERLTLRFDLLSEQGRPLSIYFYHADHAWRRDLMPIEYLDTFARDDLTDYAPSEHTAIPYQHYVYRFPNDNIRFRLSGNYILRVTEQGQEETVLFERAFFCGGRTHAGGSKTGKFPGRAGFPVGAADGPLPAAGRAGRSCVRLCGLLCPQRCLRGDAL
ncbi:type IX secretion system plug protein domain-containing protein [Rhodothermus marinus]|uniref:type IX secretion system plug protein domain-containing protein n=1 Tax=Rhodothermus marinus TaxID=29549 RepID=UPI000A83E91E|nr:type IX secretion system plug protein domain-containing protein [Rhodothermus marinus]